MYYLGIDLGLSGGITLVNKDGVILAMETMPTTEILVNRKKKAQYDIPAIYKLMQRLNADYLPQKAAMERLRAIPNQSSQTGFSLGYGTAIFKTLFTVFGMSYDEYEPVTWQREMFKGVAYDKKTTKVASIQVAKRLAPHNDFRASLRGRVDSDGLTDSFLIAMYLAKQK